MQHIDPRLKLALVEGVCRALLAGKIHCPSDFIAALLVNYFEFPKANNQVLDPATGRMVRRATYPLT